MRTMIGRTRAVVAAVALGVLAGSATVPLASASTAPAGAAAAVPEARIDAAELPVDSRLQPAHLAGRTLAYGSNRVTLSSAWSELDLVSADGNGYVLTATYRDEERRRLLRVSREGSVSTLTTYPTDRVRGRLGQAVASPSGDKIALTLEKPDTTRSVWVVRVGTREVIGAFALTPVQFVMGVNDNAQVLLTNETVQEEASARTWWRSRTGTEIEIAAVDVVHADLRAGILVTATYPSDGGPGGYICEQVVRLSAPTTPLYTPDCGVDVTDVNPTGSHLHTRVIGSEPTRVALRTQAGTAVKDYRSAGDPGYLKAYPWFTSTRQVFEVQTASGNAYVACEVSGGCVRFSTVDAAHRDPVNASGRTDTGTDTDPPTGHL